MQKIDHFSRGMGIGGWLTNYKRFHVLPRDRRMVLTVGDMEHFESYITEADVAYIASLGLDHIRLGFDQIVLEETPFVYRESILELLKAFTGWCRKYGLRPVLNLHKAVGNYCDVQEPVSLLEDAGLQDRFVALWEMLEDAFAGEPDVMFELLNEVNNSDAESWNALAARTVAAIRAKNQKRWIIVGGTDYNNPPGLPRMKLYDDPYIVYTFHNYAPFEFTHQQGVLTPGPLYYNRKMPWPCDDIERYRDYHRLFGNENPYPDLTRMDIGYLRQALSPAADFVRDHPDKILWCGEFGTIRHCEIRSRENWMRDMITILKEYDIPYCVWNYLSTPNDGNRFSLVDDDTRRILSPTLARIIRGEV